MLVSIRVTSLSISEGLSESIKIVAIDLKIELGIHNGQRTRRQQYIDHQVPR